MKPAIRKQRLQILTLEQRCNSPDTPEENVWVAVIARIFYFDRRYIRNMAKYYTAEPCTVVTAFFSVYVGDVTVGFSIFSVDFASQAMY